MQDPHNPAPKDSHPHHQATCRPSHGEQAIVRRDLAELKQRLSEIYDLTAAGSVLTWDEATYMPKGGTVARGRQSSMLRRLAHERFVDPALGRLIDRLEPGADKLPADDASLIRIVRRDYERAIRVPAEYVARANAHGSASYNAWIWARPANDFAAMIPFLEKTLDLRREYASFFAPYDHIADPMIDDADDGMTTATIQRLFAELRRELIPMVRTICDQPPADDGCLRRSFGEEAQLGFALSVATQMGYDLERGRLDKTHHPFCTKFAAGDVRITTRVRENHIGDAAPARRTSPRSRPVPGGSAVGPVRCRRVRVRSCRWRGGREYPGLEIRRRRRVSAA